MRSRNALYGGAVCAALLLVAVTIRAQPDLIVFEAGTTASAEEVNANFQALADENAELEAALEAVQARNEDLENRVESLEAFISDLRTHMEVTTDARGNPAVVVSGANLHVNNGMGITDSVNGTGNLIIGYDEPSGSGDPICSLGKYTEAGECESNGGRWAVSHKSGSHNVVIGRWHNYSRSSGLVAGESNSITGRGATVSGGVGNTAGDVGSSVNGGLKNTARRAEATVSGGLENRALGAYSVVGGGENNVVLRDTFASTIGGGLDCELEDPNAWLADC